MSEPITNEEVLDRAERWARLHANPKLRGKMDALLEDLSELDQRRVYLCGGRISGGLPPRVLPAESNERKPDAKSKRTKRAKADPVEPSTTTA